MAKILLAEDDQLIAESVVDALHAASHVVDWVKDGAEAFERLRLYQYDVAILDWNMPKLTGIAVCQQYRSTGGVVPIIMLTANEKELDKVTGLDAGADDYVTKPFSVAELQARIRSVLRRPATASSNVLEVGDLSLDLASGKVQRGGRSVELLPKELQLLEFFMRHPNQLFDVNDLLNRVWSSDSDASEDAARQGVSRLRKKLEVEGKKTPIATVKGLGYRLETGS